MNAVIHLSGRNIIHGTLFYSLEYFLFLHDQKINTEFLISNIDKEILEFIIKDRYDLTVDQLNIKIFRNESMLRSYVLKNKYSNVIISHSSLMSLKPIISADKVHVMVSALSFNRPINNFGNYIFYNERQQFGHDNYIKKIYFKAFKKFKTYDDCTLLHITDYSQSIKIKKLMNLIEQFKITNRIIVTGKIDLIKHELKNSDINFIVYDQHPRNFLSLFNALLYINENGFDYAPRLMIESYLMNKKIYFYNDNCNDGSIDRYSDIIRNDVTKYLLDNNDAIFKNFII